MRRRLNALAGAAALVLAAAIATPALSQQVASAPLSQVDPWGVGWLSANDGAIPTAFWANTNAEALGPIFTSLQAKDLSPTARALLRRIVLSRSKAPAGGGVLMADRLRLIEQLGETAHAADLRKRYADIDWGKSGERLAIEIDLVSGKKEACARTTGKPAADRAWMPLRALCLALDGDINATNLLLEQIAATDEAFGVWLMAATGAMTAPGARKPEGRYTSPFEAAVSVAAKLSAPATALAGAPADVAAAIVLNPNATLEQKRAALRPALDGGLIKSADVLAVLTAKDETPAAKPASGARATPTRPDLLAAALASFATADAKPDARAKAYADALRAAETMSDARLAAVALADAIKALPKNDTTAPHADAFARASLFTGDTKQAGDWRKLMNTLPKESADPWAAARIDLMLSYAGATTEKSGAILDRLVAAAPTPAAAEPGKPAPKSTPADKQLDLRRIENARALFLYVGTGRDLSPTHRALLAMQRTAGRGVSDAAISRIVSAADQDANGEAALAIVALIGPDASALSFAGLSDLLAQLRRIGLEKDADALALESLQVWKAL